MPAHYQRNRLIDILANPLFLAIPFALVIAFLLPNPTSKYKFNQVSKEVANKRESKITYCDLDNNDEGERIISFHNNVKGEAAIKVLTNKGLNYGAWNFHGYFQKASDDFYCGDWNQDGFLEVFVFYYFEDSLFLSVIQPFPSKEVVLDRKFITTICKRDGEIDFVTNNFVLSDINGDNSQEIVFLLNAGYSRQPRGVYMYDIKHDTVLCSRSIGSFVNSLGLMQEGDNTLPKLFCGSSTPCNIPDTLGIPYSDYFSWFFGFDNTLKPLFPPEKNAAFPSGVQTCVLTTDNGSQYLAVSYTDMSLNVLRVDFYDGQMNRVSQSYFEDLLFSKSCIVVIMKEVAIQEENYVLLTIDGEDYILINEKGTLLKRPVFEGSSSFLFQGDLNGDGKAEFVFANAAFDIIVYDDDLRNPVVLPSDILPHSVQRIDRGIKRNGLNQDELYIKTDNFLYLYHYKTDFYYYLKYPIWVLLYALIVLVLWLAQKLQKVQVQRRMQIESTINSLQMKTLKSQLDPHFMFNVLNGVAYNVAKGNNAVAHDQILRFSKLLRLLMRQVTRLDIALEDELSFVESYLELEKFRFKDDFNFKVEVEKDVYGKLRLPRMLVQLFVENAIKHGLRNKLGKKVLQVRVFSTKGGTRIVIQDNGVGRKTAMRLNPLEGEGDRLTLEMIELNKKLGNKEVTAEYVDLVDESGNAIGTRVEITL